MTVIEALRLEQDGMACSIAPEVGGAILALSFDGHDLLRPSAASPSDVRETACFTMLPFTNRIAHGRISLNDEIVDIDIDPDGVPHALHGHGWRNRWACIAQQSHSLVLEFLHDGQGWPWPYRATQTISVFADGIEIRVDLENRARRPMPAGVGIHPYFVRERDSRVTAAADRRWRTDTTGLSIEAMDDERFESGRPVSLAQLDGLDHFFASPDARITIDEKVELSGSSVAGFHLFAPAESDFFCVEPVSHVPNSFGRGEFRLSDLISPGVGRSWTFAIKHLLAGKEPRETRR